ncbi:hypothetical protein HSR121_1125 [Halapricum desulfuricans]|uniref:Uncharacterized protein n=1 Tax=Halapricum desulfuricans TaxID=2841257 RepID=A0A897MXW2_9EURY|nr:hypothetical protein HSR121_1125 [Halapricum desulfuricans]
MMSVVSVAGDTFELTEIRLYLIDDSTDEFAGNTPLPRYQVLDSRE